MTEIEYREGDGELMRRAYENKLFLYIGTFFIAVAGLSVGILFLLIVLGRIEGTY